jgi:hypothetical protein
MTLKRSTKLTSTVLEGILLITFDPSLQLTTEFHRPQGNTLIEKGGSPDSLSSDVVPRHVVPQHHIEGGGRTSFLPITLDVHPLRSFTTEHQPSHVMWVTVIVNDDLLVLGEQVLEVGVRKSMRVRTEGSKDHQIGDVHNPHAELWSDLAKESGGGDDFECDLCTDTNEDDIRTETFVGRAEPPDASTSPAVDLSFLWAKPNSRGMLRADHEVDIILRVDAVSDRAQEAVGIWRKVDTSGVGLEVKNGSDERRVLMRETVMFLTSPGGGLEVVEGGIGGTEVGLLGHLDELGILDHHRLCDTDEGLVRREQGGASCHRVTLKHSWK